jgi:hypothetical protein
MLRVFVFLADEDFVVRLMLKDGDGIDQNHACPKVLANTVGGNFSNISADG